MIIQKIDPTREAFGDYSLDGTVLTVGGIDVDLEAEQGEQEVVITFSAHNGMIHRGMMPCCKYAAEVHIPPRMYEAVEVDGHPANPFSGEDNKGEEPETHTEAVPVPLDLDSVILNLWPVENDRHEETLVLEGEGNAD
jgi:hypothetical protein